MRASSRSLQDTVVVVTGAGGGIGEAYARALHAEGANVVIAELDDERGAAVAASLGERALFVRTDVGDPSSTDAMAVVDQYGRVRGAEALRVLDLSICPDVVRANTNATAIMIAERAAGWIP